MNDVWYSKQQRGVQWTQGAGKHASDASTTSHGLTGTTSSGRSQKKKKKRLRTTVYDTENVAEGMTPQEMIRRRHGIPNPISTFNSREALDLPAVKAARARAHADPNRRTVKFSPKIETVTASRVGAATDVDAAERAPAHFAAPPHGFSAFARPAPAPAAAPLHATTSGPQPPPTLRSAPPAQQQPAPNHKAEHLLPPPPEAAAHIPHPAPQAPSMRSQPVQSPQAQYAYRPPLSLAHGAAPSPQEPPIQSAFQQLSQDYAPKQHASERPVHWQQGAAAAQPADAAAPPPPPPPLPHPPAPVQSIPPPSNSGALTQAPPAAQHGLYSQRAPPSAAAPSQRSVLQHGTGQHPRLQVPPPAAPHAHQSQRWGPSHAATQPPVLQHVSDVMHLLHGFPPEMQYAEDDPPTAYLESIGAGTELTIVFDTENLPVNEPEPAKPSRMPHQLNQNGTRLTPAMLRDVHRRVTAAETAVPKPRHQDPRQVVSPYDEGKRDRAMFTAKWVKENGPPGVIDPFETFVCRGQGSPSPPHVVQHQYQHWQRPQGGFAH
eukprot:TRINITY_DN25963_c0_g1_i1.p1 TRINITY_DN25963_c0_g1~~TRINITY_DN25963_c0_g1_i1.p1  ORF type:complete len:546 (+),score=48.69 TRINITY_DN25963_c0_g1_i1:114-1751(+)